jgi:CheY-like chemotaxis protein
MNISTPVRPSWFLVADDSPPVARSVAGALRKFRPCLTATTVTEAIALIDMPHRIAGLILDLRFPEDANGGLRILEHTRKKRGAVPALLLTGSLENLDVGRAFDLRAELLLKENPLPRLRRFALDCIAADVSPDERVSDALVAFTEQHQLGSVELEVLSAALRGRDAAWFDSRGISLSTYRARVHRLLAKTGAKDLDYLVRQILWSALDPGDIHADNSAE